MWLAVPLLLLALGRHYHRPSWLPCMSPWARVIWLFVCPRFPCWQHLACLILVLWTVENNSKYLWGLCLAVWHIWNRSCSAMVAAAPSLCFLGCACKDLGQINLVLSVLCSWFHSVSASISGQKCCLPLSDAVRRLSVSWLCARDFLTWGFDATWELTMLMTALEMWLRRKPQTKSKMPSTSFLSRIRLLSHIGCTHRFFLWIQTSLLASTC